MHAEISYGKNQITVYRTYANAMAGLTPVPESSFLGRDNTLFAVALDIEVLGDRFLAAYTLGDNHSLIATDSMKNVVLQQSLAFKGSTLESFLAFLAQQFLTIYPQIQVLRMTAKEQPFNAVSVLGDDGETFVTSNTLFSRSYNDHSVASLQVERDEDCMKVVAHQCGREGLQLIKISGSSFQSFVQDTYTTLQEQADRPLFIYLDVWWKYTNVTHMIEPSLSHYIAAEQVRDIVQAIFHRFASKSIQHLIYEIGVRLLEQFQQMAEVSFVAQNRLWDTACVSDTDPELKIYTDPRPPYGVIRLTLTRDELPYVIYSKGKVQDER